MKRYYRNPVASLRRASYFDPPDFNDYAMLSWVSVDEIERLTGKFGKRRR